MNDALALPSHDALASDGLDHLSPLILRGADARGFLDSQLTRNVPTDASVSLAGYCSPKGRLLATGLLWTAADAIVLLVSRDLAPALAKRLRMYVLRAKVTIDDAAASHRIDGLVDPRALPAVAAALAPWKTVADGARTWLRLPDVDGQSRWLRMSAVDDEAGSDGVVDAATWRRLDIRSGLPRITLPTQDRFVPQMLNLEALGAVDFKKGCFPGQEVVARSQYLGKLKRRMALASADASVPEPGTDVWEPGANEAAGLVVNAERGDDGRVALLVELPLAAFASTALRIASIDGAPLTIEPLPYPLPDNEVFVRPKL